MDTCDHDDDDAADRSDPSQAEARRVDLMRLRVSLFTLLPLSSLPPFSLLAHAYANCSHVRERDKTTTKQTHIRSIRSNNNNAIRKQVIALMDLLSASPTPSNSLSLPPSPSSYLTTPDSLLVSYVDASDSTERCLHTNEAGSEQR